MKIIFSKHARESMRKRGGDKKEVKEAILKGRWREAKGGRFESSVSVPYRKKWNGRFYKIKQVTPIFVRKNNEITIITVYVFYFNSE